MVTIDKSNKEVYSKLDFETAKFLAQELNESDEDEWTYVPIYVENGFSFIDVYDENDEYLGKL